MTSMKEAPVTFEQMKGAVGSLLFLWSQIERELAESILALNDDCTHKSPHGIARSLSRWSDEVQLRAGQLPMAKDLCSHLVALLEEALVVRNLVCHGLIGIAAQVSPAHEEALLTVELAGETRELRWTELQAMFGRMDKARWLIRDLTDVVQTSEPRRSEELLQEWKDFVHQS